MNRELNRAMCPFRIRLLAEAVIHSVCVSGLFVLPVWLMLASVQRIFGTGYKRLPAWMLLAWALLALALYVLCYRFTDKKAARRIDQLCGMDRVATAVEFLKDDSVLCRLQREDAAQHLAKIDAKKLRIVLPVPAMTVCLILGALIAVLPLTPQHASESVKAFLIEKIPGA